MSTRAGPHRWTPEEAREAGRKGGRAPRRSVEEELAALDPPRSLIVPIGRADPPTHYSDDATGAGRTLCGWWYVWETAERVPAVTSPEATCRVCRGVAEKRARQRARFVPPLSAASQRAS